MTQSKEAKVLNYASLAAIIKQSGRIVGHCSFFCFYIFIMLQGDVEVEKLC